MNFNNSFMYPFSNVFLITCLCIHTMEANEVSLCRGRLEFCFAYGSAGHYT
jgi:hypothetical protein